MDQDPCKRSNLIEEIKMRVIQVEHNDEFHVFALDQVRLYHIIKMPAYEKEPEHAVIDIELKPTKQLDLSSYERVIDFIERFRYRYNTIEEAYDALEITPV